MSVNIVNKQTIDAIVYGATRCLMQYVDVYRIGDGEFPISFRTPNAFGETLLDYNHKAYDARYGTTDEWREPYSYEPHAYNLGEILGALRCYMYQVCEMRNWIDSSIYEFCTALEGAITDEAMRELGYAVPWGIGGYNTLDF